ncbi:DnaB-like helicase C-terminal domain-containing protein [Terrihalobacillus insolitus]|uniref:DnaB-like helicase C-terminal domain-containing protein n=1 Tax=Terrihalobacillus insolitus TaxID=2950438 RepID=UPI002341D809|nr:AAA family ATPase [Terrihalobacillus insolitus]MDC3413945.1 DnaB helicase C-terminal domain-containing protein [Terrihalobacillus insolitus]
MIEEQIISKMLDENNVHSVLKFNVNSGDFERLGHVFDFVVDYRKKYGSCPDAETVVSEFPDFEYMEGVHEPFKGLSTRLKQAAAKRRSFELIATKAKAKFKEVGSKGDEFVAWIKKEFENIERETQTDYSAGTDFAINGQERREKYFESKEKRTYQYIPCPYGDIQMEKGDYCLLMAYTNRGKSWLSSHMGLHAWKHGNGVIHYSPELSKRQQESRLETLDGHFNNAQLRRGELDDEERYLDYLNNFELREEEHVPYIIKTMEDLPNGLTLDVIEADLEMNPNVSMVIIDGFNLMTHKGGGKSNRDAMTNTSRKLRQLFGRFGVLGLVVHQTPTSAEKENKEEDEAGARIVKPPSIDQYSETIAVVQDAALVLTFDQHDGVGKVLVAKAREPIVGKVIDLHCNFNLGFIEEPQLTDLF